MHDLDRTQLEAEYESDFDSQEFEVEPVAFGYETSSQFNESEEMELASELLGVSDEYDLDQFLGKLFKKGGRFLKSTLKSPLGGVVKGIVKKALPIAGGAIGSFVAPGLGTAIGSSLGSSAGSMLGLELEGLSPEDQEFEVARRLVRLAGSAMEKASSLPHNMNPVNAAKTAVLQAAKEHAPGLVGDSEKASNGKRQAGSWRRQGNKIILYGI